MAESHVVTALRAKRAELAGEIEAHERAVDQLRVDLIHVDATLRLYAPDEVPEAIPAKRSCRRPQWFQNGELARRILGTLRTSPVPLTASEIAHQVMKAKGMPDGDRATAGMIRKCVHSYLTRQRGRLVERGGRRGREGLWRVAS